MPTKKARDKERCLLNNRFILFGGWQAKYQHLASQAVWMETIELTQCNSFYLLWHMLPSNSNPAWLDAKSCSLSATLEPNSWECCRASRVRHTTSWQKNWQKFSKMPKESGSIAFVASAASRPWSSCDSKPNTGCGTWPCAQPCGSPWHLMRQMTMTASNGRGQETDQPIQISWKHFVTLLAVKSRLKSRFVTVCARKWDFPIQQCLVWVQTWHPNPQNQLSCCSDFLRRRRSTSRKCWNCKSVLKSFQ